MTDGAGHRRAVAARWPAPDAARAVPSPLQPRRAAAAARRRPRHDEPGRAEAAPGALSAPLRSAPTLPASRAARRHRARPDRRAQPARLAGPLPARSRLRRSGRASGSICGSSGGRWSGSPTPRARCPAAATRWRSSGAAPDDRARRPPRGNRNGAAAMSEILPGSLRACDRLARSAAADTARGRPGALDERARRAHCRGARSLLERGRPGLLPAAALPCAPPPGRDRQPATVLLGHARRPARGRARAEQCRAAGSCHAGSQGLRARADSIAGGGRRSRKPCARSTSSSSIARTD